MKIKAKMVELNQLRPGAIYRVANYDQSRKSSTNSEEEQRLGFSIPQIGFLDRIDGEFYLDCLTGENDKKRVGYNIDGAIKPCNLIEVNSRELSDKLNELIALKVLVSDITFEQSQPKCTTEQRPTLRNPSTGEPISNNPPPNPFKKGGPFDPNSIKSY